MREFLQQFVFQFQGIWKKIGVTQKITILFMAVFLVIALSGLVMWAQRPDYGILYSNISMKESGKILDKIQDMKIPYRLKNGGRSIYVPTNRIYELRLMLAREGMPRGGTGVGFEIFDKNNFGMTDFVQKLNYYRALQGELARTIMEMSEVESARVHIVVPEKGLFDDDSEKPTASVTLTLTSRGAMDTGQVAAIRHLVASSVEGLGPDNVTVIDNYGNILSTGQGRETVGALTESQLEMRKSVEKDLSSKVQSMIEGVLGPGSAIVRVTADLDFNRLEKTEEKYDPENAVVRTEVITSEKSEGSAGVAEGVAGVQAAETGRGEKKNSRSKEVIKNTYEINRTMQKVIQAAGSIKSLSVAVFIKKKSVSQDDGTINYVDRSPEEMSTFDEIVKKAIGFVQSRGDSVVVKEISFNEEWKQREEGLSEKSSQRKLYTDIGKNAIIGIVIIALIILFRGLLKRAGTGEASLPAASQSFTGISGGSRAGMSDAEFANIAHQEDQSMAGRQQLVKIAEEKPEFVARLIKNWLTEQ